MVIAVWQAEAQAEIDCEQAAGIGQDIEEHDAPGAFALRHSRRHEVAARHIDGNAAHDAEDRRRATEGNRKHDARTGEADHDDDDNVEHQQPEGEHHIGDVGQDRIDPAAPVASDADRSATPTI